MRTTVRTALVASIIATAAQAGCRSLDADQADQQKPPAIAQANTPPAPTPNAPASPAPASPAAMAQAVPSTPVPPAPATPVEKGAADAIVAEWPERPRLGAQMMMAKYGPPHEASPVKLVWHNQGPFKRIMVTRLETNHDFPKPHMDFLEHTIDYRVPSDKSDELLAYDGSVTLSRTNGEMSARCDLEGHNILTLNLAHDIVTGKTDAAGARKAFSDNVVLDMLGKDPAYVTALQFQPMKANVMDADVPTIPGSPKRAAPGGAAPAGAAADAAMGDAEVLGFLGAVDDNEIVAAAQAKMEKLSPQVMAYAKMLHEQHGKHAEMTLKLGQQIGVTPLETAAVDKLRVKGAGALAALIPLDGPAFEAAYIAAMVKDHTEVLSMIDGQLMKAATNDAVKKHLAETRAHIAEHLKMAKGLEDATKP